MLYVEISQVKQFSKYLIISKVFAEESDELCLFRGATLCIDKFDLHAVAAWSITSTRVLHNGAIFLWIVGSKASKKNDNQQSANISLLKYATIQFVYVEIAKWH